MIIKEQIDIKQKITQNEVKKIFSNSKNIEYFLNKKGIDIKKNISTQMLKDLVVENWNYEEDKKIIREMFKNSSKYQSGLFAQSSLLELIKSWYDKYQSEIEWPFVANNFDQFTANINRKEIEEEEKDKQIAVAAQKFRLIKEINTLRNDFVEKIIFENSESIIPTLSHSKSVDFFINGIMFDQKVSKSLGKKLIEKLNMENPMDYLKKNPHILAKWMYENQDQERFDYDYRLYVAFGDNDLEPNRIVNIIKSTNFSDPIDIEFSYKHKSSGILEYKTKCLVIIIG